MSRTICCVCRCIMVRSSSTVWRSSAENSNNSKPMEMGANGFRNSCARVARNSSFRWSAFRNARLNTSSLRLVSKNQDRPPNLSIWILHRCLAVGDRHCWPARDVNINAIDSCTARRSSGGP